MAARGASLWIGGLIATLGALGVGWYSARGSWGEPVARLGAPRSPDGHEKARPPATIVAPTAEEQRVAAPVAEPEVDAPAEVEVAAPAEVKPLRAASPAEIMIEGTVVVTGADGVEHPFENGSMKLVLWQGNRGKHHLVEIADGRWAATIEEDVSLSFRDIRLGGRRAVSEHDERLEIPTSRLIAVRARWPNESWLRVRSAETRQELVGIELVGGLDRMSRSEQHPGQYEETNVLALNASSPVDVESELAGRSSHGRETLFARAEGYAWGRVDFDLDRGGERFLDLVGGGGLEVALVGRVTKDAHLRLRRKGPGAPAPVLDLDLRGEREVQLTSLQPDEYAVSIEIGDWFRKPVVLGSGSVVVLAGGVAQVRLEVVEPAEVATAHLKGLLVLDAAWGEIAPSLRVESIATPADGRRVRKFFSSRDLQGIDGAVNTWAFDAGLVPHGDYEFDIDPPFLLSRKIDATTGDVRLEVPAPAIAAVRVVDSEGLEVTDLTSLHWNPKRPRGVTAGSLESASRDLATGRFEIRAPSGAICVSVVGVEFRGSETFDLDPGRHEVDLVVSRTVGFTLALRDGDTQLPWEDAWNVEAREVEGKGMTCGWSEDGRGMRLVVTGPGLYRFTMPAIDGYAPIPEQEVLVAERGFAEHIVELVRSP